MTTSSRGLLKKWMVGGGGVTNGPEVEIEMVITGRQYSTDKQEVGAEGKSQPRVLYINCDFPVLFWTLEFND